MLHIWLIAHRATCCRCLHDVAVQLRELVQLNQDLIESMNTMMKAVSAFVAVSGSADIADMKALIVIHHLQYNDVVRAMRIMNETVRQWSATAHNLSQYAHHPSLRIPKLESPCCGRVVRALRLLSRCLTHWLLPFPSRVLTATWRRNCLNAKRRSFSPENIRPRSFSPVATD